MASKPNSASAKRISKELAGQWRGGLGVVWALVLLGHRACIGTLLYGRQAGAAGEHSKSPWLYCRNSVGLDPGLHQQGCSTFASEALPAPSSYSELPHCCCRNLAGPALQLLRGAQGWVLAVGQDCSSDDNKCLVLRRRSLRAASQQCFLRSPVIFARLLGWNRLLLPWNCRG